MEPQIKTANFSQTQVEHAALSRPKKLVSLSTLDSVGGTLSLACAVHCLAIPFLLTALPILGLGFLAESGFEVVMLIVALVLASASLCWGISVHGQWKMISFLIAALIFFYLGHELGEHATQVLPSTPSNPGSLAPSTLHWILMSIGGLSLAVGHYLNHRLCKSCRSCCSHSHQA